MNFFNNCLIWQKASSIINKAGNEGSSENLGQAAKPILNKFMEVGGIVIPVVLAVGAILIIIKLILLGIKLAQSGDDPEMRSKIIKGMIWWGVGLLIVLVAVAVSATLFQVLAPQSK